MAMLPAGNANAASTPIGQSAQSALWNEVQHHVAATELRGLAGASFGSDGATVTLFWAGSVPAGLTDFVAQRRQAPGAQRAARVAFKQVPYDEEQIIARARALIAAAKRQGIPIGAVSSTSDFTGLRADIDPSASAEQRGQLRALGAAEITDGGTAVPLLGRRYADRPPFFGGAVIERGALGMPDGWCSLGFAAVNSSGKRGMVTAQHCGSNTDFRTPTVLTPLPEGRPVGSSNEGHNGTDSMWITDVSYHPTIFVGSWRSSDAKSVSLKGKPALNSRVCAGGGMSGAVCNATVHRVNALGPNGAGPGYFAWTGPPGGDTPLAGTGDSGSPSFEHSPDGNHVTLFGMIQSAYASDKVSACPDDNHPTTPNPWRNLPARICFANVFFVNTSAIESGLNVTIETV